MKSRFWSEKFRCIIDSRILGTEWVYWNGNSQGFVFRSPADFLDVILMVELSRSYGFTAASEGIKVRVWPSARFWGSVNSCPFVDDSSVVSGDV